VNLPKNPPKGKYAWTATVGEKGQIVIPKQAREIFDIKPGDTLIILGDIGDVECAKQLRGYKVLITGNHDSGLNNYREAFNELYDGPLFICDKLVLSHEPINLDFAFNIHGHIHNHDYENDDHHMNVAADFINYTPVNLNTFFKRGGLSKITSIHRTTINNATIRKKSKIARQQIDESEYENDEVIGLWGRCNIIHDSDDGRYIPSTNGYLCSVCGYVAEEMSDECPKCKSKMGGLH